MSKALISEFIKVFEGKKSYLAFVEGYIKKKYGLSAKACDSNTFACYIKEALLAFKNAGWDIKNLK